ncbi:MAG: hypothetical protein V1781_06055, partial [Bacteroidota bacterium]
QKDIALAIGKDKSVVSRELSRNCDKRDKKYDDDLAQRKYQQRQRDKPFQHLIIRISQLTATNIFLSFIAIAQLIKMILLKCFM